MMAMIMMMATNDGDDDVDNDYDDFNLFSAEGEEATLALYIDKYQALTLSTKVALNH